MVAIIVVTLISALTNSGVPTVEDQRELPSIFPLFSMPQIPFDLEMLQTIFPHAIAISLVGLLESCLTANVVDNFTDTPSNKNKEAIGQGIANIVSGLTRNTRQGKCFGRFGQTLSI